MPMNGHHDVCHPAECKWGRPSPLPQFIPHPSLSLSLSKLLPFRSRREIFSAFSVGSAPSSLSAGSKLSKGRLTKRERRRERGQFELNTLTFGGGEGFFSLGVPSVVRTPSPTPSASSKWRFRRSKRRRRRRRRRKRAS